MPALRLVNTLTRTLEEFRPLDPAGKRVTFYSCGPTVYDDAHIGNFRSFLNADILRRTLELLGFEVRHVMNITDVGHMTDDEDADGGGEDKMAVAGRRIAEAKKAGKLPAGTEIDAGLMYMSPSSTFTVLVPPPAADADDPSSLNPMATATTDTSRHRAAMLAQARTQLSRVEPDDGVAADDPCDPAASACGTGSPSVPSPRASMTTSVFL